MKGMGSRQGGGGEGNVVGTLPPLTIHSSSPIIAV